jgi:hypothetical protein
MANSATALPVFSPGHDRLRAGSPFAPAAPSIIAALTYAGALALWMIGGDALPGGRPFGVHLFTLGILTNLVLTFSEHFARTLTHTPGERSWWWPVVTNLGIVSVLTGLVTRWLPLLAAGATLLTGAVLLAYLRLRRMRRRAVGARFGWIVRLYERAHGAFIHGAVLGALMGVGLVSGTWFAAARIAHLHANVLGWGGLTLLATLVFFGPTMARTRIETGADVVAARTLKHGATALGLAVILLFLAGVGGPWGAVLNVLAGLSLAVYATAATRVCLPIARAVHAGSATAARPLVLGVCAWTTAVVWADALVVTTRAWRWLDALGIAALAGVLAQAMLATLVHLAPMLRGRTTAGREVVRARLERGARTRAVATSVGVTLGVLGATRQVDALPLLGLAWGVLLVTLLTTALVAVWPLPASASRLNTAGVRELAPPRTDPQDGAADGRQDAFDADSRRRDARS